MEDWQGLNNMFCFCIGRLLNGKLMMKLVLVTQNTLQSYTMNANFAGFFSLKFQHFTRGNFSNSLHLEYMKVKIT